MDQVSQIREKIDIVSLISEHIPLKKAGRNFKANCPFHGEKTPSFVVSPERQIWHCFGCGKGGDCYTFLMEYEHLEFPEALRLLAQRTGVTLQTSQFETTASSKKEKIYKLNKLAAEFYHYILTKHPAGKRALSYIQNRSIDPRVIETFKVGFAPGVGTALTRYLMQKKQYTKDEVLDAGLGTMRGRDVGDFFRNRIIFPLIDHRDNVVGFSGRVLSDTDAGPKYINTRDTYVYHKRDQVFGVNVTKDSIKKQNQVLLTEGEFDVMSCFQNGIGNVVAVKGTALTDTQVQLLSRFAQKVTICFDGDVAGKEAIKRSLPILEKKGLTVTVVVIPNGKDPDESLKASELEFKKAIKNDINVYDYLLGQAQQTYDPTTPDGKKKIAADVLPFLIDIDNAIVKEHYLRRLSTILDTTVESVEKEASKLQKKEIKDVVAVKTDVKRSRDEVLEEYLLALLIQSGDFRSTVEGAKVLLFDILPAERAAQKILIQMMEALTSSDHSEIKTVADRLPSELTEVFNRCFLAPLPRFADQDHYQKEVLKTALQLKSLYIRERIRELTSLLKQKKSAESTELEPLQKEYSDLIAKLHQ